MQGFFFTSKIKYYINNFSLFVLNRYIPYRTHIINNYYMNITKMINLFFFYIMYFILFYIFTYFFPFCFAVENLTCLFASINCSRFHWICDQVLYSIKLYWKYDIQCDKICISIIIIAFIILFYRLIWYTYVESEKNPIALKKYS